MTRSIERIVLRVWGEYACFTRPENKAERLSYDVITPSAARGVLEAIYWKPQIGWVIDRIHVLRPVRFTNLRRNEVGSKIPAGAVKTAMRTGTGALGLYVDEIRQQRAATILRDVEYVIEAHFVLRDRSDRLEKHSEMFQRRARRGQYFHHPYLGTREFPADFELVEDKIPASPLTGEVDLGLMLHDIDFFRRDDAAVFSGGDAGRNHRRAAAARIGGDAMILQALADYYHRVAADPQSEIATPGFSRQKISFVVVVRPDGTLDAVQSVGREEDSRQIPEAVIVPGESKPSGSGINPCFLWDNMAYMLGLKADDPKPERTRATFEAFRDKHVALQPEIDDDGFHAVCRFLEAWDPDRADGSSLLASGGSFGVFRLAGEAGYIHDRPAVLDWWNACLADADDQTLRFGPCLITGKDNRLARLHEPKIKGVAGAQTSGAAIVSFNQDAFESYGRTQSYNAPVSTGAAFAYAVGLNHLLARRERRFRVGDATTVFWTAEPSPIEDMFGILVAPGTTEDQETADETHAILAAVAAGRYPAELGDPRTGFYILGLSANASRLSVRFWHRDTVGSLVTALGRHFADLGDRPE